MFVTTLTEMFGLGHPIVPGPMGAVTDGHLVNWEFAAHLRT